ncbi:MAG: TIGR03364 family FAD-dependent oxidoreductase [Planctomycetaceae bacterium]|nr:TIGR03364 family FAD-dependent oxidoreductase [Planctomycetaceae bacterium]|tara:strand:+ start:3240 stop:4364 length:1125 start_codon:yes stop_codon:yes gene_type:complete
MDTDYDVAIIGGGIVGLAQAWMAARNGYKVIVFEKTSVAEGATVRNFGMIWPIGQPAEELYQIANRSREFWLELGDAGALDVEPCGSIHLAHNEDEMQVLQEFVNQQTHAAELISPAEICQRSSLVNPEGLLGGMYSDTELRVDPRTAAERIRRWLAEKFSVQFHFETLITSVDGNEMLSSNNQRWNAGKIIICSGSDLNTLYPEHFAKSNLVLCKLQMLRSVAQAKPLPENIPHIASGLTLRHYTSFNCCPSLEMLKNRIARQAPELDKFGVHVMASQFSSGEVILGDSHEYGENISPFDKIEIDELMIRELKKVIRLNDWTIKEKWHGIYAKHPDLPVYEEDINESVSLFVGTGGAGMTMSFGLANKYWNDR